MVIRPKSKIIILSAGFLFILTTIIFIVHAEAEIRRRPSPMMALEYSLQSLTDGAYEVAQKNIWLTNQIREMKQEIKFLKEEIRSLHATKTRIKAGVIVEDRDLMENVSWEERELNLMFEELVDLNEERANLEKRFGGKKADQKNLEQEISKNTREISQLAKQISSIEENLQNKGAVSQINQLSDSLKRSEKGLKYAKKKYRKLERQHGRPLRQFSKLKNQNMLLRQRVAILKDELKVAEEEGKEAQYDIEVTKKVDKERILELNQSISDLNTRKRDLQKALLTAEKKLGKGFSVPDYQLQMEQVRGNMALIKKENAYLNEDLVSLERTLKALQ